MVSVMSLRVSRDFYQIQSLLRSLKDSVGHSDMIADDSIVMATAGLNPPQILTFTVGFMVSVEFRATWIQCYGEIRRTHTALAAYVCM